MCIEDSWFWKFFLRGFVIVGLCKIDFFFLDGLRVFIELFKLSYVNKSLMLFELMGRMYGD